MNIFKVNENTSIESIKSIKSLYKDAEFIFADDDDIINTVSDCFIHDTRNCKDCIHINLCNVVVLVKKIKKD